MEAAFFDTFVPDPAARIRHKGRGQQCVRTLHIDKGKATHTTGELTSGFSARLDKTNKQLQQLNPWHARQKLQVRRHGFTDVTTLRPTTAKDAALIHTHATLNDEASRLIIKNLDPTD